jgi:hypothetical protein
MFELPNGPTGSVFEFDGLYDPACLHCVLSSAVGADEQSGFTQSSDEPVSSTTVTN